MRMKGLAERPGAGGQGRWGQGGGAGRGDRVRDVLLRRCWWGVSAVCLGPLTALRSSLCRTLPGIEGTANPEPLNPEVPVLCLRVFRKREPSLDPLRPKKTSL